jgi:hypothetical protein
METSHFYKLGELEAIAQLGGRVADLLSRGRELGARGMGALRGAKESVSPETIGLAKRLGIGGGVGAAGGAAAAGEDNRLLGALAGGALGAGAGAGAGKLLERRALGKLQKEVTGDLTRAATSGPGAMVERGSPDLLAAITRGQREAIRSSAFPMGVPKL